MRKSFKDSITMMSLMGSAIGATWFALDHFYEKIEKVKDDIDEHPHHYYISREEQEKTIQKLRLRIEKLDDKITKIILFQSEK